MEQQLSSQLVLGNLPMFGFGSNDTEALWMTCLELLSNSLDSIGSTRRPEVKITFLIDQLSMQVAVFDNGSGISSLSSAIAVFSSTKNNVRDNTAAGNKKKSLTVGRFGVGLTACMMNSYVRTGRDINIVTKPRNALVATVVNVGYDESAGEPALKQCYEVQQMAETQGTRISVSLPRLSSEATLRMVMQTVDLFLKRLQALPTTLVSTLFSVDTTSFQPDKSIEETIYPALVRSSALTEAFTAEEEYAEALRQRLQPTQPNQTRNTRHQQVFVTASFKSSELEDDATLTVRTAAILHTTDAIDATSEFCGLLTLDLWRYYNSVPVIRTSQDHEACAVTLAAVKSFKWAKFGFKTRKGEVLTGTDAEDGSCDGGGRGELPLEWSLLATSKQLPKNLLKCPVKLTLLFDVCSTSLPYSNLRKSALLETPALILLVHSTLASALKKLKRVPGLDDNIFLTSIEEKQCEIHTRSIPRVAIALTKMLKSTPEAHDFFCEKLRVPSNITSYTACTEYLEVKIGEAYPRVRDKRVKGTTNSTSMDEEGEDDDEEDDTDAEDADADADEDEEGAGFDVY